MKSKSENKKLKILVACHKPGSVVPESDIFLPIQVGKELHPEVDLGFQCDNEGDNISHKNESYCELTALYWAWKNLKDVDYIGLAHYRRYFNFKNSKKGFGVIEESDILHNSDFIPNLNKIEPDKIILPQFWSLPYSYYRDTHAYILRQDIYILYKILEKYYPDYVKVFEKYMLGNRRTGLNMFIMTWENFDKYCHWLFDVLEKMENAIKLNHYTSYKRIFGYLGEILLPVYCKVNNIKIKETKVDICLDKKRDSPSIRQLIKDFLYDCSYILGNIPKTKTLKNEWIEGYIKADKIKI